MDFELTVRMFVGDRAYGIAGSEGNPKYRSQWLRRAVQRLVKVAETVDTTERHRRMILGELAAIVDALKPSDAPRWSLVYALVRLAGRLLGYDYVRGARCHSPVYWQTTGQHLNTVVFEGGDIMQDYYDQKNAIAIRRQVVQVLRAQGHSDYTIAQVLNISEYHVKKLRHEDPMAPPNSAA
jgi:DNA-binding NarL/FixJ family response regulator